jgi:hypothetical protein
MPTNYQSFLIEHVKTSIQNAQAHISKLDPEILTLEGMSSDKIRHFLNNICSLEDGKYLEIGVWKGSTFIASLYNNKLTHAAAIDNWSQFCAPREEFQNNTTKFLGATPYTFYETDCFKFDVKTIPNKVNIYFYDAGHTREEQKLAFVHYNELFEDTFIAIVDNYNWQQVQEGTQLSFKELKYNILFEQFLASNKKADKSGWWTGIYVAVVSKH